MQVDPIKPTLKPPGTKRLKLQYDALLSNSGFDFNLHRYNQVPASPAPKSPFRPALKAGPADKSLTTSSNISVNPRVCLERLMALCDVMTFEHVLPGPWVHHVIW